MRMQHSISASTARYDAPALWPFLNRAALLVVLLSPLLVAPTTYMAFKHACEARSLGPCMRVRTVGACLPCFSACMIKQL